MRGRILKAAGKHVYVEKPLSHNPREGELAVEAARKHDRVVQLGTQRRTWTALEEAVEKLRSARLATCSMLALGTAIVADRSAREKKLPCPIGSTLSCGRVPPPIGRIETIICTTTGIGSGIGAPAKWAITASTHRSLPLGVGRGFQRASSSGGGKYRHDDDQETPDTHTATFDFGGKSIHIEILSWSPRGHEGDSFGASFHGKDGTLVMVGDGFVIYDSRNKEVARQTGETHDSLHLSDFANAIRDRRRPKADVEEGHKSTLLCHLANITYQHRPHVTLHWPMAK